VDEPKSLRRGLEHGLITAFLYGYPSNSNAGAADILLPDEAYAFIDMKFWGRLETGRHDDATDRMYVEERWTRWSAVLGPGRDAADYFNFGGCMAHLANSVTATQQGDFTSPRFGGSRPAHRLTRTPVSASGTGGLLDTEQRCVTSRTLLALVPTGQAV